MDGWTAVVVSSGIVAFTSMIASVVKSLNKIQPVPGIPDLPTNKWDVIDEELVRLHDELGNYSSEEPEFKTIMEQINKMNEALAQKE